jgi:hypothetical protein
MSDVKAEVRRDIVALWAGPGFHIVHYPLRHGTLFNIVAVFRRSAHSERGDVAAYRAELEDVYRDAHPAMKALLAMLDLGRRQAVGDRDPIRRWHQGRVVLLGDAAHPTLQSLAQGACMAIEDGLCLADCIAAANGDYEAAFRRYESARLLRTARVTLESRYMWDVYHADGVTRDVYWQMLGERSEAPSSSASPGSMTDLHCRRPGKKAGLQDRAAAVDSHRKSALTFRHASKLGRQASLLVTVGGRSCSCAMAGTPRSGRMICKRARLGEPFSTKK